MSRILIVDDHPQNRDYLCTLLQAHGHDMQSAANGAEALALARAAADGELHHLAAQLQAYFETPPSR